MSVANGSFTRTNSFGQGEARAYPRFHTESIEDPVASAREGRPIFRDEERVEIILPGNPHTRPIQIVTDVQRAKWPEEYKAFKTGMVLSPEGTPLEQWSLLRPSQVLELKALGFATIEQVAAMDDLAVQRVGMGGRRLKALAAANLDEAQAGALASQLTADNERKDAEIATLKRQVEELGALVQQTHASLQDLRNAPNMVQSHIPGMADPIEQAKLNLSAGQGGQSTLGDLPEPRKRGRRDAA